MNFKSAHLVPLGAPCDGTDDRSTDTSLWKARYWLFGAFSSLSIGTVAVFFALSLN